MAAAQPLASKFNRKVYTLADRKQTKYWSLSKEKDVPIVGLLSDSYLTFDKVKRYSIPGPPREHFDMRPHVTETYNNMSNDAAFIQHYSKGGLTMNKALEDEYLLGMWAIDIPALTILHLGACDLANTELSTMGDTIRTVFPKKVSEFLKQWPIEARKTLENSRQRAQFDRQLLVHKWLIIKVPDWGDSPAIRNIDFKTYQDLRKKANTGLERSRSYFWKNFKAVFLLTHIDRPKFKDKQVHLIDEQQDAFNEQVFSAAAKVLCRYCKWTIGKYDPNEHNKLRERSQECDKVDHHSS